MSCWYQHYQCLLVASSTAASSTEPSLESLDDNRRRLEDATGRIPLYLQLFERCSASEFQTVWCTKFASAPQVQQVYRDLHEFHLALKQRGDAIWSSYLGYVREFIQGGGGFIFSSFDNRYMYIRDGQGHFACGLARDCLIAVLRMVDANSARTVSMKPFLDAIKFANPSVRGFFVEQACLVSILTHGLPDVGSRQNWHPSKAVYFNARGETAACDDTTEIVLYIPHPLNYPSVDAVLRILTLDASKGVSSAKIIAIQVTLDQKHKSVADFFHSSGMATSSSFK